MHQKMLRSESSKNGGKWRFFEGKKSAILPVLIEFSKHKPLLSLLLCWRTFLALTSKKNVGPTFSTSTPRAEAGTVRKLEEFIEGRSSAEDSGRGRTTFFTIKLYARCTYAAYELGWLEGWPAHNSFWENNLEGAD